MRVSLPLPILLLVAVPSQRLPSMAGTWRSVLDLAGGPLPFEMVVARDKGGLVAQICNGPKCADHATVTVKGSTVLFDIADYAATITAERRGDSLVGVYHNVGRNGPRSIPFRASRGSWARTPAPASIIGSWDAWYITDQRRSPRVLQFQDGRQGLEGAVLSNTGDLGMFWGGGTPDSFSVARFDGVSVYVLAGRLDGDTLRGVFHAGLRTQTPFVAVRSSGAPHLTAPTALTSADTVTPFRFGFPDLAGRQVTQDDARLRGRVVLVDIFGSWCVTCHEATPDLLELYRDYHARGFEILGLGYEVTGDTTSDNPQIRRFRDKFRIPWILLHAGASIVEETAASLPQLHGFTAYPTTLFLGRDGRIRQVYAGFRGPATGAQHTRQIADYRDIIERLLTEP
ncbi:MAG TPA: TlpA disulfide reductase family protein [Gemmatimonadales bacterium]|nr:TlpA disulfide reductase family protein [Gemmatimonadales bacterium]